MNAITSSDLRNNLKAHMDRVHDQHSPLIITRKDQKNVVLISIEDFNAYTETYYLLSSQANAQHLMESIKQAKNGQLLKKRLIEV